jgi:hypothetical protein
MEAAMSEQSLIGACDRLLKVEEEVKAMPEEQSKWFMEKPGHADCFVVAKALKELLTKGQAVIPDTATTLLNDYCLQCCARRMAAETAAGKFPTRLMILCPTCGNKRCPT